MKYASALLTFLIPLSAIVSAQPSRIIVAQPQSPVALHACSVIFTGDRDRRVVGWTNYHAITADGTVANLYTVFENRAGETIKAVVFRFDGYDASDRLVWTMFPEMNGVFSRGVTIDNGGRLMWEAWIRSSATHFRCSVQAVRFADNAQWASDPAIHLSCSPSFNGRYSLYGCGLAFGSLIFRACSVLP